MKRILALALVFCLFTASSFGIAPPKNKFHRKLENATFALYGHREDIRHFLCTATIFQKTATGYLLLSAGHCVLGVSAGGELPDDLEFQVTEEIVDEKDGVGFMPVKVTKAIENDALGQDFSVLELTTTQKYPVIPLGDESELRIESKIINVSFSVGVVKQTGTGRVASVLIPNAGPKGKCDICQNHYMVQLYGGPGASGSAIVSEKTHKIVGIEVGGFDANIGGTVAPISEFTKFNNAKTMPLQKEVSK